MLNYLITIGRMSRIEIDISSANWWLLSHMRVHVWLLFSIFPFQLQSLSLLWNQLKSRYVGFPFQFLLNGNVGKGDWRPPLWFWGCHFANDTGLLHRSSLYISAISCARKQNATGEIPIVNIFVKLFRWNGKFMVLNAAKSARIA